MSSRLAHPILQLSTDGINPSQQPPIMLDGASAANVAGSFFSVPIWVDVMDTYRFVFSCTATGTPVGSVKLQACIDEVTSTSNTPTTELQTWTDLSFSINGGAFAASQPVSAATTIVLDENRCNYSWVRLVYTATSGLITPKVRMRLKGLRS